jgi:hypothetical protein
VQPRTQCFPKAKTLYAIAHYGSYQFTAKQRENKEKTSGSQHSKVKTYSKSSFSRLALDSRDINHLLSMDYDFLDVDLDDFPVQNISEDQQVQSDDNDMASEDNDFEVESDEVGTAKRRKSSLYKKNGNWTSENLEQALNNIDEGIFIQFTAKLVRIPVGDHNTSKTTGRKRGPVGVLIVEEEDLKLYLLKMHNLGHPLTRDQVKA